MIHKTTPTPASISTRTLILNVKKIMSVLLVIWALLLIIHLVAMQIYFNPKLSLGNEQNLSIKEKFNLEYWQVSIFDLDEEESFGTYYNSLLLLFAGILMLIKSSFLHGEEMKWKKHWFILGIIVCCLSLDEIVGLHEWLNSTLKGIPWTNVALPLVILYAIFHVPFLFYYLFNKPRTLVLLIISAFIYFGGAIGVEHFTDDDVESLHYNMFTALEEGMELLGVISLIYTMFDNLMDRAINKLKIDMSISKK